MEINKSGLKFRKLQDNQVIIETDDEATVSFFSESEMNEKMMSHSFQQLEHFCHRFGKENCESEDESSCYRFYSIIENFCNDENHFPGKEFRCNYIYQGLISDICGTFTFVVTNISETEKPNSKKFFCVNLTNLRHLISFYHKLIESHENISCFISVIDTRGEERFPQSIAITPFADSDSEDSDKRDSLVRLAYCDDILHHASDLLHSGYLVIYVTLEFPKRCKDRTDIIHYLHHHYEEYDEGSHPIENLNDVFLTAFIELCKIIKVPVCMNEFSDDFSIVHLHSLFKDTSNATEDELDFRLKKVEAAGLSIKNFKRFACVLPAPYSETEFGAKMEEKRELLQNDNKKYGKFFCNLVSPDLRVRRKKDDLGFKFDHIHYLSNAYLECENPIIPKQNCLPFNANCGEVEENWKFLSIFNTNDEGELMLKLDSDFGKVLCEISIVLKNMLEFPVVETLTQTATIKEHFLEPFKNIYRLSKGASYIKANTIHDIISLYEASDFYDIPPLLKFCRELLQRHICVCNVESIRKLSETCLEDADLRNIITGFETDYKKFLEMLDRESSVDLIEKVPRSLKNEDNKDNQYDFYR